MSPQERHQTAAADRVPWGQLVAYGMGGLIPIALFNIAGQLMAVLGNISLGLSALWLGAIMIIPRLWEAFSDPVIGHLSDNTRTRWGRRRPYILVGGLAVALSFVAMWWVPRGDWIREILPSKTGYDWFQLGYILGGLLIFFTACAVFEIPHGALGLEMSADPHERTRLFSAKSFLGNLFAMGTPWLYLLANLEFFRGAGGNLVDGMRYVTIFIAVALVPMTFWWFVSLREPGFVLAKEQKKSAFWQDMRTTVSNKTFLTLTAIVFTLAMGFNFVSVFATYIAIFYLYGGEIEPATLLLGLNGTVWAITALVAVFPLNWLSRRFGKRSALLIAILLMCAAQVAKIFCYRRGILFQFDLPEGMLSDAPRTIAIQAPYLVLIPTMLLSAGMLMFFTLGPSMVGDVCDEDELKTGTRTEGTYFSVFWWFIKIGSSFASVVTGVLLVFAGFDEHQNVTVDAMQGDIAVIRSEAEKWHLKESDAELHVSKLDQQLVSVIKHAEELRIHLAERIQDYPDQEQYLGRLIERIDDLRTVAESLRTNSTRIVAAPADAIRSAEALLAQTAELKQQSPETLFRLRLIEIGLPLALSCVSILLTLRYPLTEARCYEIKAALEERRSSRPTESIGDDVL